jgi:S-adenosylmethionine decarboxylase
MPWEGILMKAAVARLKGVNLAAVEPATEPAADLPASVTHYVERDGLKFAGTHLIIDVWGASRLDQMRVVERMMREAVEEVGATLLRLDLHHFAENGGISGVALLAESHISIHTWPETGYAALDIFVCGTCDAYRAVPVIKRALNPERVTVAEHKRGLSV